MRLEQKKALEEKLRAMLKPEKQLEVRVPSGTGNVIRRRKGDKDKRVSLA